MIVFTSRHVDINPSSQTELEVELDYMQRRKSRLKVTLDNGQEAAIALPRGTATRPGDILQSDNGERATIVAAREKVSVASTEDSHLLARACYHLGNRHVALQIDTYQVIYLHDHVLDEMVELLGLAVHTDNLPFQPEDGAYSGGHQHHHSHDH